MTRSPAGKRPRVLVFDSGLGGLTVLEPIRRLRPDLDVLYAADDAAFPYGGWGEGELVARVVAVMGELIAVFSPDLVVVACNTASTLVLAPLRAAWPALPFVGTVPAVKPAAEASASRLVSVLATPGTVARDYTKALVRDFAGNCEVALIGSPRLAGLAERRLHGEPFEAAEIAREIAPCFVQRDGRRTDKIVLACTHFPLLTDLFAAAAPWPIDFIDPAPAIARRVDALLGPMQAPPALSSLAPAVFTSGRAASDALRKALRRYGLTFSSLDECAASSMNVRSAPHRGSDRQAP